MKGEEGTELDSKVHNIGIENTQVSVKIIPSCTINCLRDYPFSFYMKDYRNLNHVYLEGYKDGNLKMHNIGMGSTLS